MLVAPFMVVRGQDDGELRRNGPRWTYGSILDAVQTLAAILALLICGIAQAIRYRNGKP